MYVVTFYSYKGGVGRSMALMNVAYILAQSGKRVLAVDFDLEAPGLSSYGPFRCAGDHPGLVEYVHEYEDTNVAPDAAQYIIRCEMGEHPIWLMPAGRHTEPGYAAKFGSINWRVLYEEREGFLLFEDLKQQWAGYEGLGFDYVLIDSRTGHTDIGGICTRQLPDAVVIMFLPTPQNLEGLRPIVRAIRKETAPVRREKVRLHFCPSNLPDLDDQELILKGLLEQAESDLGYAQSAADIHHYGALDLLQQPIYAMTNPNSRLTGEYINLKTSIIGFNLTDRDGALTALSRLSSAFDAARQSNDRRELQNIQNDAALIAARFPDDVEIAWGLAALANEMTRPEDELDALNTVVEGRSRIGLALLRRAAVLATLDDRSAAVEDLRRLLTVEQARAFEVRPAVELLKLLDVDAWRNVLEAGIHNPELEAAAKSDMLISLLDDRTQASRIAEQAASLTATLSGNESRLMRNAWVLALISDGRFSEAMTVITSDPASILASNSLQDVFNYAVCEWALARNAPKATFERVLVLGEQFGAVSDPNGLQCFALARSVLGQRDEAIEDLRRSLLAAKRVNGVFSCWRYLSVQASDMVEDLEEMLKIVEAGGHIRPPGRNGFKGANARAH